MNGYCNTLGGFFGAIREGDGDGWQAVEVYRDGNQINHGHFDTEEEAEEQASRIHAERLQENGQFGVGA